MKQEEVKEDVDHHDSDKDSCEEHGWRMPRTYCLKAWQDFLNLSKSKKRTEKAIRKCLRKQLQYIRRDIGYIVGFIRDKGIKLDQTIYNLLNVLTTLYGQQLFMYENRRTHSIPNKIVSIRQHWVRPIVRGKAVRGKVILPSPGKEFFTSVGKKFFT